MATATSTCNGNWVKSTLTGSHSADSFCRKTLDLAVSLQDPGWRWSHPAPSVARLGSPHLHSVTTLLGWTNQPRVLGWALELRQTFKTVLSQRNQEPLSTPLLPRPVYKTRLTRPPRHRTYGLQSGRHPVTKQHPAYSCYEHTRTKGPSHSDSAACECCTSGLKFTSDSESCVY